MVLSQTIYIYIDIKFDTIIKMRKCIAEVTLQPRYPRRPTIKSKIIKCITDVTRQPRYPRRPSIKPKMIKCITDVVRRPRYPQRPSSKSKTKLSTIRRMPKYLPQRAFQSEKVNERTIYMFLYFTIDLSMYVYVNFKSFLESNFQERLSIGTN